MKTNYYLFLFFFSVLGLQAQVSNDSILKDFNDFLKIPESNVYLHLNKSILLPGEDLGFAAYVYDQKKQKPSEIVENLYCQILNEDKEVVKEQLLLVNKGKTHGIFKMDSLMANGNYTIRAFTNWMKNFDRPHFYESSFKVLNDNPEVTTDFYELSNKFDIQITPEGGQLIENVLSTVIVSVRDNRGRYSNNVKVELINNNKVVKEIPIDNRGLGRFLLKPSKGVTYQLRIKSSQVVIEQPLPDAVNKGVGLTVTDSKDYLFIGLNTNRETLSTIKGQEYLVAINDHTELKIYPKKLNNLENILRIDINDLNAGMNQVSLFTSDRKLLSQRLYFNYNGFVQNEVEKISLNRELDSLKTIISLDNLKKGSLSVSVHPTTTIALDKSQSITNSFNLNPFLNVKINTPIQYLRDITPKKKYDLDNLLICYGWAMYDWTDIFEQNRKFDYAFENGVSVTVNPSKEKFNAYFIYSNFNSEPVLIKMEDGEEKFTYDSYYPMNKDKFNYSAINNNGKARKVNGLVEFNPKTIPDFDKPSKLNVYEFSELKTQKDRDFDFSFKAFKKTVEKLDTVLLIENKEKERQKKIERGSLRTKFTFLTDFDRVIHNDIFSWLNSNGFRATQELGKVNVRALSGKTQVGSAGNKDWPMQPTIVLDGMIFRDDTNILLDVPMEIVDYIEIDLTGDNFTPAGKISITTNPLLGTNKTSFNKFSSYQIPLTFTKPSKFYRPSYNSYTDDFFDKLGVIDWQGNLEFVDGKASFTMPYLGKNELLLHIQGWTEDGILIDEIRTVSVDSQ